MHESRQIHADFIFSRNPDTTWAMKMFPIPGSTVGVHHYYHIDLGVVSEVYVSGGFSLALRRIQHTN